jgi:hypothetical protein
MPLAAGGEWTYEIRSGLNADVVKVTAGEEAFVAGAAGRRLAGPGGDSDLAWREGRLVASRLGGLRAHPPLPLFAPQGPKAIRWTGALGMDGQVLEAEAELEELAVEAPPASAAGMETRRTRLTLSVGGRSHRLDTWFSRGIGIVQQEHRSGGGAQAPTPQLSFISGP